MNRLQGRKALVTGAGDGVGDGIARGLAEEGADVAIQYDNEAPHALKLVQEIVDMGRRSVAIHAELDDPKSVTSLTAELHEKFGTIDTLVNCAETSSDNLFTMMGDDQWKDVIQVNLTGVFRITRALVDEIVSSGHGRIINISSMAGQIGGIGQVNYAASKSGIIGFTKALARELVPHGTTVNAVAPGFVESVSVQRMPEDARRKILSQIPMRRFGTLREMAMGVVYLVSPDADYITGAILNLNGGMYI